MPFMISLRSVLVAATAVITVTTPGAGGPRTVYADGAIAADLPDDLFCKMIGTGSERQLFIGHVNESPGFDISKDGVTTGGNTSTLAVPVSNYPSVMDGNLRTLAAASVIEAALRLYENPRTVS